MITWTNTSGGRWSAAANWSPNQVPKDIDNAFIAMPGTYVVVFDAAGNYTNAITNICNLTLGTDRSGAGRQTFAMTNPAAHNLFRASSNFLVTGSGVLLLRNCNLHVNSLVVSNGGVLNMSASLLTGKLTVTNGGVFNATTP